MSKQKSILFTALLCLLFCATELYALDSNESKPEKQNKSLLGDIYKSLDGTVNGLSKSLSGTVDSLGKSLSGTVDSLCKSLDGTVKGLSKSLGGTVDSLGESLGGTLEDIGDFVAENGEGILVAGVVLAAMIVEADYYHHGYHRGYHHHYHPR